MLLGGNHTGDHEGASSCLSRRLHLKPDARQRDDDVVERGLGREMLLEPGDGELHFDTPLAMASIGRGRLRKP
jgi:hypothetical protein